MEHGRNQLLNLHQRILAPLTLVSTWFLFLLFLFYITCLFSVCGCCEYLACFNSTTKLVDSAACVVSVKIATIF